MKLYRFSPIKSKPELLEAARHIHFACHDLCKMAFGKYLPNSRNMGVFCHYDDEYKFLAQLRKELTAPSGDPNQKYYLLHEPIIIGAKDDVPATEYTHLYIRKPDPYRAQAGDVDFYLEPGKYAELKKSLAEGAAIKGARIFERADLDMIELHDPDIDALAYVSTKMMTEKVRVKIIK